MAILHDIQSPADLKLLEISDLPQLAREIRERILLVLSKNGGHLSSNLGTVELTLALHYVFHSPKDRFLFDVSHQTYTHKLLTGRNTAAFDHIRKNKGLSGFAHPKESEHDHFFAGHAGTALSLGLGLARARDIMGSSEHVVPIIGDATLTCGLTLEALNNCSRSLSRFITVLNDNEMSISNNVGRLKNMLSSLASRPSANVFGEKIEALLAKIPLYGSKLASRGHQLRESMQGLVSPAPFFDYFGLDYVGPIDGHNVKELIAVLQEIKHLKSPVLLHVHTKKGQGVELAEKNPIAYHGVKPFDLKTCKFIPNPNTKPTFPKVAGAELRTMGERDEKLVVVTPAMELGSCLGDFATAFPDRFFDVGIAEGHAVTFAGGLAKYHRLSVVCSIYATFLHRALDNLFHDVCLQETPVVFAIDRAGLAAGDGATHHGIYDISFLKSMPGMVICQPRDGHVLKELLNSAFSWKRVTAIRYPNEPTDTQELPICPRPLGKGEVLVEGEDLLIIALGYTVELAYGLREKCLEKGLNPTIVDPIFVQPLDIHLIDELLQTHTKVVTIEEHSLRGGLGDEVNRCVQTSACSDIKMLNCGIPDTFIEHGSRAALLKEVGLDVESLFAKLWNRLYCQPLEYVNL